MLSESWERGRSDPKRRINLFKSLSQIILGLMKQPLPRIGSWTIDDSGVLTLTNRPLTLRLHQQENSRIPTVISRSLTYTSVEPYYMDLIACQDNRLRYQPNSIHDEDDGRAQLAALTTMRALIPKFTHRPLRSGPFTLSLTDLHQSNIFVDDDWHVTRIIDLEWACARPIEMLGPPYWLSGRGLDELAFYLEEYAGLHEEFIDLFEEEEMKCHRSVERSRMLRTCWEDGTFWYAQALDSPSALLALFTDHIQPRFTRLSSTTRREFDHALAPFWDYGAAHFIFTKVREQEHYNRQVREIFANTS